MSQNPHMTPEDKALAFYYRNPPDDSNVPPQKFTRIATLLGKNHTVSAVKWAVKNFRVEKGQRGRKTGWRKTTKDEDKAIMAAFHKARKPLGSAVEARDVWLLLRPPP